MPTKIHEDKIRALAKRLDDAIEADDIPTATNCFAEACTISAVGRTFHGRENLAQVLIWLRDAYGPIRFDHRLIMVKGDCFFEEFNFLFPGHGVSIPATEILLYEGSLIKELRIYVDRLDLAQVAARNRFEQCIIDWITSLGLRGFPA